MTIRLMIRIYIQYVCWADLIVRENLHHYSFSAWELFFIDDAWIVFFWQAIQM